MIKKWLLGVVTLLTMVGISGCLPPKPKPPVDPTVLTKTVVIRVVSEVDTPVVGAAVTLDNKPNPMVGATDNDGAVTFVVPQTLTDSHLWVTPTKDYQTYEGHVNLAPVALQTLKVIVQTLEPPFNPTREEMKLVKANFCNLQDSTGRVIFSSSLAAQTPEMQDEWIAREKAAGGTHYVMSIQTGYTNYPPVVDFYATGRMDEWVRVLDKVLKAHLTPVVFLDDGGRDPGTNYFRQVLAKIPATYYDKVVWVAGWETVAGDWTSKQFKDNNMVIREMVGLNAIMAAHLSPGRLSFSSHPVEPDDPWAGDEMDCWRWGSTVFEVFLYQTDPYRPGDAFTTNEGKGERAEEVATRVLGTHVHGAPDWFAGLRRPTLIAFETVAYFQIRGQGDSEYARTVADFFKSLGYQGFGNGLPH